MKELDILYQCDDNYVQYLVGSIASVLENNFGIGMIKVHILDAGISLCSKDILEGLVHRYSNSMIYFYETDKYRQICQQCGVPQWRGKYVAWYKLFAVDDLTDVMSDRILYMNPHCLVADSLDCVDDIDFHGKLWALTADPNVSETHKRELSMEANERYYNTGVMIINYDRWINGNFTARHITNLTAEHDYPVVDQDYINAKLLDEVAYVGPEFCMVPMYWLNNIDAIYKTFRYTESNFHKKEDLRGAILHPRIIYGRPVTSSRRHQCFVDIWNHYLRVAGWTNTIRQTGGFDFRTFIRWGLPDWLALPLLKAYLNHITTVRRRPTEILEVTTVDSLNDDFGRK